MKILLDTHCLLWWDDQTTKLSKTALSALEDENNTLYISDASIWELQIKSQLGKIGLRTTIEELITDQTRDNGARILHIDTDHILGLQKLPFHHKDPFDRLLASQA
ncbi:MAG: type II toxin-antitoxin system VapC family toxin [Chloracidobacterium sp.]|nr:type II toxin-antitoxin system VapC family toxin [Chloracidobacterium sp.]